MTDILKQIESELAEAAAEADRINKKVAALREAAQQLRPYYQTHRASGENGLVNRAIKGRVSTQSEADVEREADLSATKIEDAAVIILQDTGNAGMTSRDIAEAAIDRGYRSTSSRNPENDPRKITMSFHVTMKRLPEKFEHDGKRFRLKN